MRRARWILMLALAVMIAAPLAGCGKKPRYLEAPEGGTDFPRTYPTSR